MRWLVLLVFASACGDNIAAISFEDFASRKRAAECERQVRCGLFSTPEACMAYIYMLPDPSLAAAIADGRVRYDELAALNCLAAVSKISCDSGTREARIEPAACTEALAGTAADGDTCAFDTECMSRHCSQPDCDPATCCAGVCAAFSPAKIDEACGFNGDCVSDAYCGVDHLCHALGNAGDTCYSDAQCGYALGCVTATNPGLCVPLAAHGAPCPDGRCAALGDHCGPGSVCVADGRPGEACSTDSDCSPTAWCDPSTRMCAELPDVGMPCIHRCVGAAWCDPMRLVCQPRLPDGEPCSADNLCASNFCGEGPVFDPCAEPPVCD
jgi:hypothetical protein